MGIPGQDTRRGALLIIASGALFVCCESIVKSLAGVFPIPQLVFFRSLPSALFAWAWHRRRGLSPWGVNRKVLLLRGVFGLTGICLYFFSLSHMLLADASILIRISPVFVMLFSSLFLGEAFRPRWLVVLLFMLAGTLLVVRPPVLFAPDGAGAPAAMADGGDGARLLGLPAPVVCILASASAGAAYTALRALGRSDAPWTVISYFAGFCLLGTLPVGLAGGFVLPSPLEGLALLALGSIGLAAQYCLTAGYAAAPAGEVALFSYVQILMGLAAGWLFFAEFPPATSLVGGALVLTGAGIHYLWSRRDRVAAARTT